MKYYLVKYEDNINTLYRKFDGELSAYYNGDWSPSIFYNIHQVVDNSMLVYPNIRYDIITEEEAEKLIIAYELSK